MQQYIIVLRQGAALQGEREIAIQNGSWSAPHVGFQSSKNGHIRLLSAYLTDFCCQSYSP